MADDDSGFDRPELRAPGGGLALHQDRLTFLTNVRDHRTECLRELQEGALSEVDEVDVIASWSRRWSLIDNWVLEVVRNTYRIYEDPEEHRNKRESWRKIYRLNQPLIERGEWSPSSTPPEEGDTDPPFSSLRFYGLGHTQHGQTLEEVQANPFLRTPEVDAIVPGWPPDPEIDSEGEARAAFKRYWEERRRRSLERGASQPTEKRAHTGGSPDLHFAWLARWQVGPDGVHESHQEIADDPGEAVRPRSRQTVQEAVARTADRIGLTRRSQL